MPNAESQPGLPEDEDPVTTRLIDVDGLSLEEIAAIPASIREQSLGLQNPTIMQCTELDCNMVESEPDATLPPPEALPDDNYPLLP